ncbi:hypothetical protein BS50DRAFT_576914 [Corynespora cassiicola Philippines]|uniref:Hydrophobin n=1 Tax=Corynespora cassiicola Philippines TaxID=1448308 RepID=A0A2T2NCC7_CORCC|nr:hypothetical protein BS50DRAFT_576914 [Corynespora cassiicola Philippines]
MKFSIAILSLAALASASNSLSVKDASTSCGDQVVSCCNTSSKQSSSGLIAATVGPILPGGCKGLSVNVIALLNDLGSACGKNEVKCCQGNKNTGLVNADLQCTSIPVL